MPDSPPPPPDRASTAHGSAWTPLEPAELGRLLPQYEILSLLGRGGMGAVYYAVEKALDRPVALKLLPAELSAQPGFAERFAREARAMAKLSHPNIVALYEFGGTSAGHQFFTMEFVEGTTLAAMIHGPGLNPDQALVLSSQICLALAYAHERGVVHRDMKPSNILVDTHGQVKIADFGLARLLDPTEVTVGHTVTGAVMGTPDYMAPEQKRGMAVDHRADIYSLGVMLYEMLCRQTPQGAFPPPSKVAGCDAGLDRIVDRAMQPAPERRYQSSTEMKVDVDGARAAPLRIRKSAPRKSVAVVALLTLVLLGTVAWKLGWLRPSGLPPGLANKNVAADSALGWRDGFEELVQGRIRPEFLQTNKQGFLSAKRDVQIHLDGVNGRPMRNQVVRMKFRGLILQVQMRLENGVIQEARSYSVHYGRTDHVITLGGGSPKDPVKLAEGERPRPHGWFTPHDLEVRAIDDLISVFLDGRQVIAKRDPTLSSGRIRISINDGSHLQRLAWIDLGDSEIIPPLSGWPEPVAEPLRAPPAVASDQWRDGLALLEQGVLRPAPFARQQDGTVIAREDNALLDLRAPGAPLLEDQVMRVRLRGKAFTLETRRTEADSGGKPFAFGFRYQSSPPQIALVQPMKGRSAAEQVSQTPPPGFDWKAAHTLTLATIGDRLTAWVDGTEMLTMRRQGPLSGHMAIRATKDSVIEKIEFADLGPSAPPQLGVEETLDGHRYRMVWAHGILWSDARTQAERLGGHLATVSSAREHDLIVRMSRQAFDELGGGGQIWLGGFREAGAAQDWQWVTGEPFRFTRWSKGKPSPTSQNAAATALFSPGGTGWHDWSGYNERGDYIDRWIEGYVVEWDK